MSKYRDAKWRKVMQELPYCQPPYSKKNWGNPNHSLCSYQGKLKPAIANFLVQTFVPKGGRVLDPFSGVGTIPFEAALNGKKSFGIDISPLAFYVSSAKVQLCSEDLCNEFISQLSEYIANNEPTPEYIQQNARFGYNKTLGEYYEPNTFKEILSARQFFQQNPPTKPEEFLVISSLLHILHGNRPYALSRKSHPIVPYAPSGEFVYKSLIEKVSEKVKKSLNSEMPKIFQEGQIFLGDSTKHWDDQIEDLDAIITSPPFYDSTKFYMANWIRLWFTGWNEDTFNSEPEKYVDEKQKVSFDIYDSIFENARERLKQGGDLLSATDNKANPKEVFELFGGKCFKTGKELDYNKRGTWHIDHIMPSKYLWPLTKENAALLSNEANEAKSGKWPSEFYTDKELVELSKLTGAPLEFISSKEPIINPDVDPNKAVDKLFNNVREDSHLQKLIQGLKKVLIDFDLVRALTIQNQKLLGLAEYQRKIDDAEALAQYEEDLKSEQAEFTYELPDTEYSEIAAEPFECYKWNRLDQEIIDLFGGDKTVLIGCYKSKKHLEWINSNGIYNIRLGNRAGSIDEDKDCINNASILVLYSSRNISELLVYKVNSHQVMTAEDMLELHYPSKRIGKKYMSSRLLKIHKWLKY